MTTVPRGAVRPLVRPLVIVLVVLVAGCGGHPPRRSGSPVIVDGPDAVGLSATAGSGGQSVYPPRAAPGRWLATVGGFVLCLRGRSSPARILDVRPRLDRTARPVRVALWLRTVTPSAVAAAPPARRRDFEPVGSALGAPPRWGQPYRDAVYPGHYSRRIRGLVVDQSCARTGAANASLDRRRVPADAFRELMVTLTVDGRGGRVRGFDLTYEQGGTRTVLRVDWLMTACGSATRSRLCPR